MLGDWSNPFAGHVKIEGGLGYVGFKLSLVVSGSVIAEAGSGIKAGSGIANNPDSQFLFSALKVPGNGTKKTDAFVPEVTGPIGDVVVEQGASITSPANESHTGGLVALIAPSVRNLGSISTPNGQTILAAGLQVGMTPHNSADPSLRGMDVAIGSVSDASVTTVSPQSGTAMNGGVIQAMEGNTTIAGKTVFQNGVIESSTSTDLNGRIDLLASYNAVPNPQFGVQGDALIYDYSQQNTGLVETGPGSVMRILPEWLSDKTVSREALALNSVVSITGLNVHFGDGSILLAPGAVATAGALSEFGNVLNSGVTVDAGTWTDALGGKSALTHTMGQIYLDQGALIDVAGSTAVQVASSQNFLKLQLRGSELADSPLQRNDKNVRGVNMTVDARLSGTYNGQAWVGTPLGDVSGFLNLITRTVAELTTAGGSVAMTAGDSVVMRGGSSVDVSGGWKQYSGGQFSTTKLIYQGHLVDISQATPDRVYSGIYKGATEVETSAKWGVTKTYKSILDPLNTRTEAPYISGASGGSITIQAPSVALDGALHGNTTAGPRQIRNSASLSTLPVSSSLTLDLSGQTLFNGSYVPNSRYAPMLTFAANPSAAAVSPFSLSVEGHAVGLSAQRSGSIFLSPDLPGGEGFGNLTINNHDGGILLPSEAILNAGVNGSITLDGAKIDILGKITAPGGAVSLASHRTPFALTGVGVLDGSLPQSILDVLVIRDSGEKVLQYGAIDTASGLTQVLHADGTVESLSSDQLESAGTGVVNVARGASITTAGSLVNDAPNSGIRFLPGVLNGGKVSVSGYRTVLEGGSLVDVSGGALLLPSGERSYGNAGSISINGGQDDQYKTIDKGFLQLGSTLQGYAGMGANGGALSLGALAFRIGGASDDSRVTVINPTFFNEGGFSSFSLTGVGLETSEADHFIPGVSVAAGTVIHPEVLSQMVKMVGPGIGGLAFAPHSLPAPYRAAPSISLNATGLSDQTLADPLLIRGSVVVEPGSSFTLDPQLVVENGIPSVRTGALSIKAPTIAFAGSATVPGGSIKISGGGKYPSNLTDPSDPYVTVDLASASRLSTAGEALYARDPLAGKRVRFGSVLPGGSISVSGNILAESGSVLDASGASGIYDLFPWQLGRAQGNQGRGAFGVITIPYCIDSVGGAIALSGGQALLSDATLRAASGGPTAPGGSLTLSSGRFYGVGKTGLVTDLNLSVVQSGPVIPGELSGIGASALGLAMPAAQGLDGGGGEVTVSSFVNGGFHNLTLDGNVLFSGPVTISMPGSIKVASGGVLSADSLVSLTASYVSLGTPFVAPLTKLDPLRVSVFDPATQSIFAAPTWGNGQLTVHAQVIDVGNLSLQKVGSALLDASGGAIRGDGTFAMAGDLVLRAAQVYPVTGASFSLLSYNHDASGVAVSSGGTAGSISVEQAGSAPLPLSALGSLSLYADTIIQSGTLVAPFGKITLGWNGSGTAPIDPVSGAGVVKNNGTPANPDLPNVPTASRVVLSKGSLTSVSAVDQLTGQALSIPYGTSSDGTSWVDPSGTTITGAGLPSKSVSINASDLVMEKGAIVDLQGGGAVTANQWISGLGGTIPWLADTPPEGRPVSWAILPGYQNAYSPKGYGEGMIPTGTRITLPGGAGLPAGTYTLLPASYATLPGAYLLTPSSISSQNALAGSVTRPDGSVILSGTLLNGLDSAVAASKVTTLFELSSPSVLAAKVKYQVLNGDTFFAGVPSSARAVDGGNLLLQGKSSMSLQGMVFTSPGTGGSRANIDVASIAPILVTGPSGPSETPAEGTILLDASVLSGWNAGSLLIGGIRSRTSSGAVAINPTTTTLEVDTGTTLRAPEVILVAAPKTYTVHNGDTPDSVAAALDVAIDDLLYANQLASDASLSAGQVLKVPGSVASVRLDDGASVLSTGGGSDAKLVLTGNGALLRVGSAGGTLLRSGFVPNATDVDGATPLARLVIGQGVLLSGAGVSLDSTSETTIDPTATIAASSVRIAAGGIALNGEDPLALSLSGTLLQSLSASRSLSLTSYSSLTLYDGTLLGAASMESLSLHAAAITGDNGSAGSQIIARNITLDNESGAQLPDRYAPVTSDGMLTLSGSLLTIGSGALRLDGFQDVKAMMTGGVRGAGKGGLTTPGNLTVDTPLITGAGASITSIKAGGDLVLESSGADQGLLTPALGSSMTLSGATVSVAIPVKMPSGSIKVVSTSGDLLISSLLDVGGTAQVFPGVIKYTDAGTISLSSQGDIHLAAGSDLNLNAQSAAGSAGSLSISAANGVLLQDDEALISASKGAGGADGKFTADLLNFNNGDLSGLERTLTSEGFTGTQNLRIRGGDVTVSDVKAHAYTLSADTGSITVTGTIDASGKTGGSINLFAGQSVVIEGGAMMTVHGETFDAAGKGGSIDLEAGNGLSPVIAATGRADASMAFSGNEAVIDLQSGSVLDLGVTASPGPGQSSGSLMLKAPQTADASDVQINPIGAEIRGASSIVAIGSNRLDAASPGAASIDPLPTWGNLPTGLAYLPGQSVIGSDGNVYTLTTDPSAYASYVGNEVSGGSGVDPSESSYWSRTVSVWDSSITYAPGEKTVGADGLIYTAAPGYAPMPDESLPEPGTPDSSYAWTLLPGEGNLKQLALNNAADFTSKATAAFAGSYADVIHLRPGEEILNSQGGLVLNGDWDLSRARYGIAGAVLDFSGNPVTDASGAPVTIGREPGLLSLRASGDITFRGSLSDGFGDSINNAADVPAADGPSHGLYFAPLLPLLTDAAGAIVNQTSWSYRITAGGDTAAADPTAVDERSLANLSLGVPGNPHTASGSAALTQDMVAQSGQYQVIRTGTGDITLSSSGDIRLLSPFSTIYTAGTRVEDASMGGTFDTPVVYLQDQEQSGLGSPQQGSVGSYPVQYASRGGNVSINAGRDLTRLNALLDGDGYYQYDSVGDLTLAADSSLEMPSNWLYRRGSVDPKTGLFEVMNASYADGTLGGDIASTTWWVDYSNFFQGVGALGGGNIVMNALRDISNVDAVIPTNFRMAGHVAGSADAIAPDPATGVELGGGNLSVLAGNNIDAGVYYVERGNGTLRAGGSIITNPTRDPSVPSLTGQSASDPAAYLPTTLFLGKGNFSVQAQGDVTIGPVANAFLAPQGVNNSYWYKTYFSTYGASDSVSIGSLSGNLTLRESGATETSPYPYPLLQLWYQQQAGVLDSTVAAYYEPWIRTSEMRGLLSLGAQLALMPPSLSATALSGDITIQGNLTTAPSPTGEISLVAGGAISGLASSGSYNGGQVWTSATINLSDADPAGIPGVASPLSKRSTLSSDLKNSGFDNGIVTGSSYFTDNLAARLAESGSYSGSHALIEAKQLLHDASLLHLGDTQPLRFVAAGGGISGLTLFSSKRAEITASGDISDAAFYIQNVASSDISTVSAGGSITLYDPQSTLRSDAVAVSELVNNAQYAQDAFPSGDLQISGPGSLEVLAAKSIDLGNDTGYPGDTTIWNGITSIGNARNLALPFQGADLVVGSGANLPLGLASEGGLGLSAFVSTVLSGPEGTKYLSELADTMTYSGHPVIGTMTEESFAPGSSQFTPEERALFELQLFYIVLRDTGRNYNKVGSTGYKSYASGEEAIKSFFNDSTSSGSVTTWSRDIRTKNGGNIGIFAPGGGLTLASTKAEGLQTTPGIVTEHGGGINIFTQDNVDIGIGRIFTLRGGDIMIWSDKGNIAAGASAKTVASAPPTRVLIDPQSGDVQTDLAGLASGGGIGVLDTVEGIPPGNVDLIAPSGVIDAGDAGIRSSGNLNLAATKVLNADNIAASGSTAGAPPAAPPPAAPNVSGATAASSTSAANNSAAQNATKQNNTEPPEPAPSIISVDVLGYGGAKDDDEEDQGEKKSAGAGTSPPQASL